MQIALLFEQTARRVVDRPAPAGEAADAARAAGPDGAVRRAQERIDRASRKAGARGQRADPLRPNDPDPAESTDPDLFRTDFEQAVDSLPEPDQLRQPLRLSVADHHDAGDGADPKLTVSAPDQSVDVGAGKKRVQLRGREPRACLAAEEPGGRGGRQPLACGVTENPGHEAG